MPIYTDANGTRRWYARTRDGKGWQVRLELVPGGKVYLWIGSGPRGEERFLGSIGDAALKSLAKAIMHGGRV